MSANVTLLDTAFEEMSRHLQASYPQEGCGFVFGRDGSPRELLLARAVANTHEGDLRRRFRITPDDYRKAETLAGEMNLNLLGVYHSHPDHPAQPSEQDRLQAVPYFSYLILSVTREGVQKLTSWQLNDQDRFEEEMVEIVKEKSENRVWQN